MDDEFEGFFKGFHAVDKEERRYIKKQTVKNRIKNRAKLIRHCGGKCVDCGWTGHIAGFEFDHVDGRGDRPVIGKIIRTKSFKAVIKEIEMYRIELVCGTCHNIRTYKRRKAAGEVLFLT